MKTLDELRVFYNTELLAELNQFEAKRRQVMQNSVIVFAVLLVCGLLIGGAIVTCTGNPVMLLLPLIIGIALGAAVFGFLNRDYKAEFKQRIISRLIRFVEPQLTYQPQQCVSKEVFKQSSIFQHHIDRYHGEDCVSGKVGQTEIVFSEVHAEYMTTSGSGKHRRTEWHTIFKGLFFIADFNKYFHGQTVILPDTAEKLFGGFGQTLQSWTPGRAELIKLEDPEFEKEFVVYGDDQVEARYILSPSLMQRITEFRNKTGGNLYLSFTGSRLYVAVPLARNMFEPSYFTCAADFKCIEEYYHDLLLAVGIVEDLNLNTRIWSKT